MPTRIGPYEIEREIGSGGMGMVYLGRHIETSQLAAVKVLQGNLADDESFIARFSREVEAVQQLSNPHIVEFYEAGIENKTHYFAMEYVDGDTLADLIHQTQRIPWQEVISISQQICTALKAAHDTGIIHRDLKPSNLLITDEGIVKLTDFGVAQVFAARSLTVTGGIVGTAEYMSPEQAQGQKATKRSDLYSLGAVMYAMLTGRPPFRGRTHIDVIQKQRYGQFDRPIRYVEEIPIWLDDIVCQLLEKDPEKRFPDAYVLYRRLDEVLRKVELANDREQSAEKDTAILQLDEDGLPETIGASQVGPERLRGPGAGTLMRHLLMDELQQSTDSFWTRLSNNPIFLTFCLVLLISGGLWWFQLGEATPKEQFAAALKMLEEPEGDGWLRARDELLQPLLDENPEEWAEKVEPYLRQIEAYETRRNFRPGRVRLTQARPQTEIERFLAKARHYESVGEFSQAERLLKALKPLLEESPEHRKLLELTQQMLVEIEQDHIIDTERFSLVESSLERAEKLLQEGKVDAARRICESVQELYEAEPDATQYLERAKRLLEQKSNESDNDKRNESEGLRAGDS